jgi:hypothetical protein
MGGCTESALPQASDKGSIDALNAMPASPVVGFFIEQRALGGVAYKDSLGAQAYDDLTYTFRFEINIPGDSEPTEIATQSIDVVADTDYTIVATGSVTDPTLTVWERAEREWEDTETAFEIGIAHLSPALGEIDVYIAPQGTVPVSGEERAKLSYGERAPEFDLENGNYEVIITARDDPTTILYQSFETSLAARISYTLAIFDADPSITGDIAARLISRNGLSGNLPDSQFPPTLRTVHSAFGTENLDIYADEDISDLIFSNLGFGESTGDLPVIEGTSSYTYTAVGNPGAIIDQEAQLIPPGQRVSTIVAGQPGSDLSRITLTDNRRSVETNAKLRLIHSAANFDALDVYLIDAGSDITEAGPTFPSLPFGVGTDFVPHLAGSFDLILTLQGEKDPIATPLQLDFADGDVVEALFLDTVDPVVADIAITSF